MKKLLIFPLIISMLTGCDNGHEVQSGDYGSQYIVHRVTEPVEIDANWDKPVWQDIEPILLDNHMGDKPEHKPVTQAKLAWDDEYIYVIFRVEDQYVQAVATEYHGNVWQDSCVEFFFTPSNDISDGYFNLETNCIGTILLMHQEAAWQNRVQIAPRHLDKIKIATSFPKGMPISEEIQDPVTWTLEYALPLQMLTEYSDVTKPSPGETWRANFYKCADNTSQPHWLTWSVIPFEYPNFHVPESFGTLKFAE